MDHLNNTFIVKTNDNKIKKIDKKADRIIEYFKLDSDFEKLEFINLEKVSSAQFDKLILFCEAVNYELIELKESFYNHENEYKKFSLKLKEFYDKLSEEDANEFIMLSNELAIPLLEEICLMKMNTLINSKKFRLNKRKY